jgi:hypothetical protein
VSDDANATSTKSNDESSSLMMSVLPLLILFGGAMTLFWLSEHDMGGIHKYWEIFVPVVAVFSLISGWSQVYTRRTWVLR